MTTLTRQDKRKKRHVRVRQKVRGTAARPRLCIYKSCRHIYVQALDDVSSPAGSLSLMQICTNSKDFKASKEKKTFCNKDNAKLLGVKVAEILKGKGIETIVFDRSGYKYHGVVKILADTIREAGVQF